MAVRQYIGARYVPLYVGDWDATRNYEPLSIVTDANGNSFTSLKDVPAGTPLTNRDYWIQTSSFSGAVDTLQRRMNAAEGDISALQGDVSGLQGDVSGLQGDVANVNDRIDKLSEKNYILIGDSFAGRSNGWMNQIEARLNLTEGVNVFSKYGPGSGFCNPVTFSAHLNTLLSSMTAKQKESINYLIVVGGVNDTFSEYSQTTISQAVAGFLNNAKAALPGLEKIFVGYNCTFSNGTIPDNVTRKMLQFRTRAGIVEGISASQEKACYIAGLDLLLNNTTYVDMSDGVHLTTLGEDAMTTFILNVVNGGVNIIQDRQTVNGISYIFMESGVLLLTGIRDVYNGSPINILQNSYTVLYSGLDNLPFYPQADVMIPVKAVLVAGSTQQSIDAILRIRTNGDISILSPQELSGVTRIAISGGFSSMAYYQ